MRWMLTMVFGLRAPDPALLECCSSCIHYRIQKKWSSSFLFSARRAHTFPSLSLAFRLILFDTFFCCRVLLSFHCFMLKFQLVEYRVISYSEKSQIVELDNSRTKKKINWKNYKKFKPYRLLLLSFKCDISFRCVEILSWIRSLSAVNKFQCVFLWLAELKMWRKRTHDDKQNIVNRIE